jgi:sulfur-carrier protein
MRIRIPSSLRRLTAGQSVIDEQATTVAELVDRLDVRFPGVKDHLCEPDGALKRHINVFIGGTNVRDLQGMATPLQTASEVLIAPAMAGG